MAQVLRSFFRSGSSSTKRKPPLSIQELRKALHVIPTRKCSDLGKSGEATNDPQNRTHEEQIEKAVPPTINVEIEGNNGDTGASITRSERINPTASSNPTRSEALRGKYVSPREPSICQQVDHTAEIGHLEDSIEGNEEHNDVYNTDDLDRDEIWRTSEDPSSKRCYSNQDDLHDPFEDELDELDDIKMGYETSKREAELLKKCSELNKVIADLRRSKDTQSYLHRSKDLMLDMRVKSAGNTPFRRSDLKFSSSRRRFQKGRSYSPIRDIPNFQWRPIAPSSESDPEMGHDTTPKVYATGPTAESVNHTPLLQQKIPNGNMHTIHTKSATQVTNSATQVTAIPPVVLNTADTKHMATNVKPDGKKAWADLLKQNHIPNFNLEYIRPESNENSIVDIPDCVISDGARDWDTTLVGYFLGRKLPYTLVRKSAPRMWDKFGLYEILATDTGYFFFKFNDKSQSDAILEGGPWHFAGQPIIMKSWTPGLTLSKESQSTIPVWVNFFYLPMELWNPEGLSRVASAIGKPLHVDRMTATKQRISYARVCIEMCAENEPIDVLTVQFNNPKSGKREAVDIKVQYQWTPLRCAKCKTFGHNCEKKPQELKATPTVFKKGPTNDIWMIRRKGKEVVESSEPIPSHQLHDTNSISSCRSQVEANPDVPQTEIQQLGSSYIHPEGPGGSAGVATVAAQTINEGSQQQALPKKQPRDHKRTNGMASGNSQNVGKMVQQKNMFSALNDVPDDGVTNDVDQSHTKDPPDNSTDVTDEGRIGPQWDNGKKVSHAKLTRFVESSLLSFLLMIISSWNIRGLNRTNKQREVAQLIHNHSIDVMGIVETKIKIGKQDSVQFKMLPNWDFFTNVKSDSTNRIWLTWNPCKAKLHILHESKQVLHVLIEDVQNSKLLTATFVYGLHTIVDRQPMWSFLSSVAHSIQTPWVVLGDFNEVLGPNDIFGDNTGWLPGMHDFTDCVNKACLLDLRYTGLFYTWSNRRFSKHDFTERKLDRVLVNNEWLDSYPNSNAFFKALEFG